MHTHNATPNDLHICLLNTRSLVNKLSNFQSLVCSSDYSIFCITETWLSKDIFDNEILPYGYSIYRKDRDSRGGGVLLAVKNNIISTQMSSPPDVEIVSVLISTSNPFIICVIYIPPNSSDTYHEQLHIYLTNLVNDSKPIILLGDFNFPDVDWATYSGSSPKANKFCDLLFQLNLSQLINEPTHNQGNILDLVITNNEDIVYNLFVHPQHYQPISLDHFVVSFSIDSYLDHVTSNTSKVIFDYSKADYPGLINYLFHIDFSIFEQLSDIDSIWLFIKDSISSGMDLFIPKIRTRSSQFPKWYTSNIHHQIKCLRSLRKKYKSHHTDSNLTRIKVAEDKLQTSIQQAKANFEANLVHNFAYNNDSKIFQHVRNITKSASFPATVFLDDSSATQDIDKATLFNSYFFSVFSRNTYSLPQFDDMPSTNSIIDSISITEEEVYNTLIALDSAKATGIDGISPAVLKNCATALTKPLHYLFSYAICYCCLPSEWQIHCIIPIFKAGNKNSVSNYRPISLLCIVSKVLEHIIYDKLTNVIFDRISTRQFGFMKGRSTLQQLLIFLKQIFEHEGQTDVIYLDFSKAFDRVPHNALLLKLWQFGITGNLWWWLKCYLNNRLQCVRLNGSYSTSLPVLSGVPQGSILGPLLFLVYINDLFLSIQHSNAFSFADDTKLFKQIFDLVDSLQLQEDLNSLAVWSHDYLAFNTNKFVHLSFNNKLLTSYKIDDLPITSSSSHRDLGIILSSDLSWKAHYNLISSRAYKTLGLLRRTFSQCINISTKRTLYIALVRSQLLYCSPLWHPYLIQDISALERVQRRATKYILNDYNSDYKTRLIKLNLLPLMYTFELCDILFFIKSIQNPSNHFNIQSFITFSSHSTRSSSCNKLQHVYTSSNKQRNFYFNRLPRTFNNLPAIDLSQPFFTIKTQLTSFLWQHFIRNFDSDNLHSLHFTCPCSICSSHPKPPNFTTHTNLVI